eukprot:GGOE01001923.1.p2 GENE.GGOE01001923.1~~GGOE01001923.1.p2  ORF type:complete len:277 (+),score=25.63 GGOE01001923.1:375-1205(+)
MHCFTLLLRAALAGSWFDLHGIVRNDVNHSHEERRCRRTFSPNVGGRLKAPTRAVRHTTAPLKPPMTVCSATMAPMTGMTGPLTTTTTTTIIITITTTTTKASFATSITMTARTTTITATATATASIAASGTQATRQGSATSTAHMKTLTPRRDHSPTASSTAPAWRWSRRTRGTTSSLLRCRRGKAAGDLSALLCLPPVDGEQRGNAGHKPPCVCSGCDPQSIRTPPTHSKRRPARAPLGSCQAVITDALPFARIVHQVSCHALKCTAPPLPKTK